jgi:hypothetical protein
MSELLAKFKELCNQDIELPDSGKISITQLNVEFQNNLFSTLRELDGETQITLNYIQFLNNYIYGAIKKDNTTFLDKLFLLAHWRKELTAEENKKVDLNTNKLKDKVLKSNIGGANVEIKFKIPTLTQENTLLSFILSRETLITGDVLFFDSFRFIESITLSDQEYKLTETSYEDLYKLYLLFDIKLIESITNTINDSLGDVFNLRSLEADFSFFVDL